MKASTPEQLPHLFASALAARDARALAALYEEQGMVTPEPGRAVRGSEAIHAMLTEFLAHQPQCTVRDIHAMPCGDLALVRAHWTMLVRDAPGGQQEMGVAATLLARRQAAGHWLVVIDAPQPLA